MVWAFLHVSVFLRTDYVPALQIDSSLFIAEEAASEKDSCTRVQKGYYPSLYALFLEGQGNKTTTTPHKYF